MKKILAIFGLTLALAACSDNNTSTDSANSGDSTVPSMRPTTETTDTGVGTNSGGADTLAGGSSGVRSGIGAGDPVINTGSKTDSTKNQ
jgi:hypothetical protein